jgi:hypothetical protein
LKDIEVDCFETKFNETTTQLFHRGNVVEVEDIEKAGYSHANLHFGNSAIALDVPLNSFEIIS